ncbi:MAG: aminotransferase class I/II-fold pyridoxal phosphate-dependent enzyme [Desulfuromonadales bacterium]
MKTSKSDFAIFGGPPAFSAPLFVGRPNIGDREYFLQSVNDILDRRWLTNQGSYVKNLEKNIAEYIGAKHCIVMCNATIALEIAIKALDMTGEVIIPSMTFIATAHSLQWQQVTPVFCDIDPLTHNIDPECVEKMITPKTTGILPVHLWGRPCNIEMLTDIARRNNLRLLFDAAHAFGCSHKGKMIGNFGDAEVLSFHATKFFNTFEGGAIITNNDCLAEKIRLMKNFGFSGYDNVSYIGTNGKMSEISAAMGLAGLRSIGTFIETNYSNYQEYQKGLAGIPGIEPVVYDESEKNNYQYIVLEIDEDKAGINRDLLIEILHAENVLARRYFYPGCHRMEPYRSFFPHAHLLLPHTEKMVLKVMSLPNGTAVTAPEIRAICDLIKRAISHSASFLEWDEERKYG